MMAKGWNICPRCGRNYQSITNLPCGIGDCRTMGKAGGDPNKGTTKGRTEKTTKGVPAGGGGGYVVHKSGPFSNCLSALIVLAAGASGLIWSATELVHHLL